MRLGFAVAIHVDPDVLLVDEVLAVGDEGFTHKCLDKFARVQAPRQDDPARHAFARPGRAVLRRGAVARRGPHQRLRRSEARHRRLHHRRRAPGRAASSPRPTRRRRSRHRRPSCRPTSPRRRCCPTIRSRPATGPADMFRATEGPLGIARGRDHRRHARRQPTASPRTSSTPASVSTCSIRMRAPLPVDDFVVGVGLFNAEGVCCYGTNTDIEELTPERLAGDAEAVFVDRRARSRRGHLQARRRRPQAGRLPVRLPPAAVHLPRQVAREGRRHLPPAAHLAVHRRRAVQEDARDSSA